MTSPDDFDPGPARPVSQEKSGDRWALSFTQVFPHPPAAVWSALTDPDELMVWAPYSADRNLASVGPATLLMTEGGETSAFDGEVTVAQPPLRLDHAWGRHRLQWRLRAVEGGTEVTLLHVLDAGDEADELPMMAAGWHLCLVVAESHLNGSPMGRISGAAALNYGFESLRAGYQQALQHPET